jgi:hypothetical protein
MLEFIASRRSRFSVSIEMLMRLSPASRSSCAMSRNVAPLVVIARSIGFPARGELAVAGTINPASFCTNTDKCARIVGSPPVSRMPSTSKWFTQIDARRCSSS